MRRPHIAVALGASLWLIAANAAFAARNKSKWSETIGGWTTVVHAASRVLVYGTGAVGVVLVGYALFVLGTEDEDKARWRATIALAVGSMFTIFAVIVGALSRIILL